MYREYCYLTWDFKKLILRTFRTLVLAKSAFINTILIILSAKCLVFNIFYLTNLIFIKINNHIEGIENWMNDKADKSYTC